MPVLSPEERDDLVERIAQAVIDRIDERERVSRLADMVVERALAREVNHESNQAVSSSGQIS
jgi:hypothetical protein